MRPRVRRRWQTQVLVQIQHATDRNDTRVLGPSWNCHGRARALRLRRVVAIASIGRRHRGRSDAWILIGFGVRFAEELRMELLEQIDEHVQQSGLLEDLLVLDVKVH